MLFVIHFVVMNKLSTSNYVYYHVEIILVVYNVMEGNTIGTAVCTTLCFMSAIVKKK